MCIKLKTVSGLLLSFTLSACVTVTTVNIGTKTSLERQLAGELEPMSNEELLVSSMRAQSQITQGSLADLQARALAARRRQLFNRDDINEGKKLGCLGEGISAKLLLRPCQARNDAETSSRYEQLVSQEQEDRNYIIDWAIAADNSLTPADRPEVVNVYHRLLLETMQRGEYYQNKKGKWVQR
ncbi:MAG: DUF1318 domain-containing protein [Deltaproteobacteria bacterium]|nr:DUF1318 domain-containing protein [Deltaproteobacteria bacterium]